MELQQDAVLILDTLKRRASFCIAQEEYQVRIIQLVAPLLEGFCKYDCDITKNILQSAMELCFTLYLDESYMVQNIAMVAINQTVLMTFQVRFAENSTDSKELPSNLKSQLQPGYCTLRHLSEKLQEFSTKIMPYKSSSTIREMYLVITLINTMLVENVDLIKNSSPFVAIVSQQIYPVLKLFFNSDDNYNGSQFKYPKCIIIALLDIACTILQRYSNLMTLQASTLFDCIVIMLIQNDHVSKSATDVMSLASRNKKYVVECLDFSENSMFYNAKRNVHPKDNDLTDVTFVSEIVVVAFDVMKRVLKSFDTINQIPRNGDIETNQDISAALEFVRNLAYPPSTTSRLESLSAMCFAMCYVVYSGNVSDFRNPKRGEQKSGSTLERSNRHSTPKYVTIYSALECLLTLAGLVKSVATDHISNAKISNYLVPSILYAVMCVFARSEDSELLEIGTRILLEFASRTVHDCEQEAVVCELSTMLLLYFSIVKNGPSEPILVLFNGCIEAIHKAAMYHCIPWTTILPYFRMLACSRESTDVVGASIHATMKNEMEKLYSWMSCDDYDLTNLSALFRALSHIQTTANDSTNSVIAQNSTARELPGYLESKLCTALNMANMELSSNDCGLDTSNVQALLKDNMLCLPKKFEQLINVEEKAIMQTERKSTMEDYYMNVTMRVLLSNVKRINTDIWQEVSCVISTIPSNSSERQKAERCESIARLTIGVICANFDNVKHPENKCSPAPDIQLLVNPLLELAVSKDLLLCCNGLIGVFDMIQACGQFLGTSWNIILQHIANTAGRQFLSECGHSGVGNVKLSTPGTVGGGQDTPIHKGFKCLRLVLDEHIDRVPIVDLLHCLGSYISQTIDVNISLTVVNEVQRLMEFVSLEDAKNSLSSEEKWHDVFKLLVSLVLDSRPEVRNSVLNSIFSIAITHGKRLSHEFWKVSILGSLATLHDTLSLDSSTGIPIIIEQTRNAAKHPSNAHGRVVLHHSRDTIEKQWSETIVLLVHGTCRVIHECIQICSNKSWIYHEWDVFADNMFCMMYLYETNLEVASEACSSFFKEMGEIFSLLLKHSTHDVENALQNFVQHVLRNSFEKLEGLLRSIVASKKNIEASCAFLTLLIKALMQLDVLLCQHKAIDTFLTKNIRMVLLESFDNEFMAVSPSDWVQLLKPVLHGVVATSKTSSRYLEATSIFKNLEKLSTQVIQRMKAENSNSKDAGLEALCIVLNALHEIMPIEIANEKRVNCLLEVCGCVSLVFIATCSLNVKEEVHLMITSVALDIASSVVLHGLKISSSSSDLIQVQSTNFNVIKFAHDIISQTLKLPLTTNGKHTTIEKVAKVSLDVIEALTKLIDTETRDTNSKHINRLEMLLADLVVDGFQAINRQQLPLLFDFYFQQVSKFAKRQDLPYVYKSTQLLLVNSVQQALSFLSKAEACRDPNPSLPATHHQQQAYDMLNFIYSEELLSSIKFAYSWKAETSTIEINLIDAIDEMFTLLHDCILSTNVELRRIVRQYIHRHCLWKQLVAENKCQTTKLH